MSMLNIQGFSDGRCHTIAKSHDSIKAASPAGFIRVGERVHGSGLLGLMHPERQVH